MKTRNRIFFIFLTLEIAISIGISLIIFARSKQIMQDQIYSNLEAVSLAKKTRLENMIKNNYNLLEIIASAPYLTQNSEKNKGKIIHKKILDTILSNYANLVPGIERIDVTDYSGIVIASSDSSFLGRDLSNEENFQTVTKKGKYLGGFFVNKNGELCITSGMDIKNPMAPNNLPRLFLNLKADEFINLTNDYTGLGLTGETVLAKTNKLPVILTPTRFSIEAAMDVGISPQDSKYVLNLDLEKKEGVFEDVLDYRGKEVIASARQIEDSGWAIITKIDRDEAYKSISSLRNFLIIVNLIFLILTIAASYFIGRYLARPVEELTQSILSNKANRSDARINKPLQNELGIIADSYNTAMTNLEQRVKDLDHVGQIISHDLRAPLTSINPLINFIKEDNLDNLNPETLKMLDMIKVKSSQMDVLIQEIIENVDSKTNKKHLIDLDSLINTSILNLNLNTNIPITVKENSPIIHYNKNLLRKHFEQILRYSLEKLDKEKSAIFINVNEENLKYNFIIKEFINKDQLINISYDSPEDKLSQLNSFEGELVNIQNHIEKHGGKFWMTKNEKTGNTYFFTINKQ